MESMHCDTCKEGTIRCSLFEMQLPLRCLLMGAHALRYRQGRIISLLAVQIAAAPEMPADLGGLCAGTQARGLATVHSAAAPERAACGVPCTVSQARKDQITARCANAAAPEMPADWGVHAM